LLEDRGTTLGERQVDVIKRLNSVPSAKARKAMRAALRDGSTPAEKIAGIVRVLEEFGIQPAEKVEPLPAIDIEEVRLVSWMAVRGTKPAQPS